MVLFRAMRQFHRHGFHATSVQTLVEGTGIGRGSLYDTFHSKRGLFICALRRYISTRLFRAALDQPSARGAILGVFESLIEQSRDGCFVVNTSIELAPHDQEIDQVVAEAVHETEQLFLRLIDQAQATGEIPASVDPALAARGLLGLYLSLGVLLRAGSVKFGLREVERLAAALLTDRNPTW